MRLAHWRGIKGQDRRGSPFRFEAGNELVSGDADLPRILRMRYGDDLDGLNRALRAGNDLAQTIPVYISIDEALHYWSARPDIVALGKLVIAREILAAEQRSWLFQLGDEGRFDRATVARSWLWPFFTMAMAAIRREDVGSALRNVTIINFNYDRTVEHFIYWGLQQAVVPADVAAQIVKDLNVIRPYGTVGPLDWHEADGVAFGGRNSPHSLFAIAERIQTYTEQHQNTDVEERIDDALEAANLLIFLGFGFHPQNMDLITPREGSRRGNIKHVIGTVFGI